MNTVIKADNIKKIYSFGTVRVEALKGVSLEVKRGEFISVMGPSGSGKSTLMHILGCLDTPTSGKYFLDGEDVSTLSKNDLAEIRNKKIGFVFQTFNLLPYLTVLDNVLLPVIYNKDANFEKAVDKAKKLLERVGIENRINHLPAQLSGGERQRVAIVRALINEPVILLADEPTGNLDTKTGEEILKILKELNREKNVTEIIVTHDPAIAGFTEKIIRIKDGLVERTDKNSKKRVDKRPLSEEKENEIN